MNLEQFATLAGVEIEDCDPEWGGRVAYKLADHPNSTYCGYRTKEAAYKSWLEGTFGKRTAKAVVKLLKSSNAEVTSRPSTGD